METVGDLWLCWVRTVLTLRLESSAGARTVPGRDTRGSTPGSLLSCPGLHRQSTQQVVSQSQVTTLKQCPLVHILYFPGFLISGGWPESSRKKVELFNPSSGASCPVPDLEEGRSIHTSCAGLVCGQEKFKPSRGCEKINGTDISITLKQRRAGHLCWSLPDQNKILLLGGSLSPATTELVSESSSSFSFHLQDETE